MKIITSKYFNIKHLYLLFFIAITGSGCITLRRPLLLRNRPNVPPPTLDPKSDKNIAIPQNDNVVTKTPAVLDTNNIIHTPPLVIEEDSTQIIIPEIKSVPLTHTVKKGDSFWRIARMYGVSKEELASCNNLSVTKSLKTGTTLVIPPGGVKNHIPKPITKRVTPLKKSPVKKKPVVKSTAKINSDGTYTIKRGDSLWKIARKFNTTTQKIADSNSIDKNAMIKPGTTLIIPKSSFSSRSNSAKVSTAKTTKAVVQTPKKIEVKVDDSLTKLLNDAENANDTVNNDTNDISDLIPDSEDAPAIKTKTDLAIEAVLDTPISDDLYTEEVLPNETLTEISERHGLTVNELLKVNPDLKADEKLKPFSTIKIPNKMQ